MRQDFFGMAFDPYALCPCGSGQKYKWCCQAIAADADRVQLMIDNHQMDAALKALDEALRKAPDSPLLALKKAALQAHLGKIEDSIVTTRALVKSHPAHPGAQGFLVRLLAEDAGPHAAIGALQQALEHVAPAERGRLAPSAEMLGMVLIDAGYIPAARKHLELAISFRGTANRQPTQASQALDAIDGTAASPAWLRNPYRLAPAPEGANANQRARFEAALGMSGEGRWAAAAAAFDGLSREGVAESDRNLGLLRIWLGDHAGGVAALRRYTSWVGPNETTVDLEALCQFIVPPTLDDVVEHLQLIWPLRRRDALLEFLRRDPHFIDDGSGPIDSRDEESPEVEQFRWLDKPRLESLAGKTIDDVPQVLGRVHVGQEIVALETFDDGLMASRQSRFLKMADGMVPPAHPRSKTLERVPRADHALLVEWALPDSADPDDLKRIRRAGRLRLLLDKWPKTPLPALRGKTPEQASKVPEFALPLRAAVWALESSIEIWLEEIDVSPLRARLGISPEPAQSDASPDPDAVHISRLDLYPIEQFDDEHLVAWFNRSARFMVAGSLDRAARAIIGRPSLAESSTFDSLPVYQVLGVLSLRRGEPTRAIEWIEKGRSALSSAVREKSAMRWDLAELKLRARGQQPEQWVPFLAAIIERSRNDEEATRLLIPALFELGLVRPVEDPERPDDVALDSSILSAVLARYGPRITTASGNLAVAEARSGIWTPEKEAAEAARKSAIVTPGVANAPDAGTSADKPRLIIPGR